ncbi:hypothetical protein ACFWP7_04270 [Streptomyces sp. NPDC058470]
MKNRVHMDLVTDDLEAETVRLPGVVRFLSRAMG